MSNGGLNLLVCGSQKLDDAALVKTTLDTFFKQTNGNIDAIFTSKFSGACEYAAEWVKEMNYILPIKRKIELKECTFDFHLAKKNQSLYEQLDIPDFILRNDDFFQSGKSLLINKGIKIVMAFPNKEGILGPSTKNIQRFAELAEIPLLDCSLIVKQLELLRKQTEESKNTLEKANAHPMRKF